MELSFTTVDQLCSKVDLTHTNPVVDLSEISFFRPFALIYLGMFLRYHNARDISFRVIVPRNLDARKYLTTQNFWERFNFNPNTTAIQNILRCKNCTSLNDIVDIENRQNIAEDIAGDVLSVLHSNGISSARMITEVVSELIDNFAYHSEQKLAALMMQYYPQRHESVIAIGDCGIGIRASLSSSPKFSYLASKKHYEAILQAFEPLVTRKQEGGTGLTMVRDSVMESGGHLILASGDEYVRINKDKTIYGTMSYDLPGVQISIAFPEWR